MEGYTVTTTYSVADGKTTVADGELAEITLTNIYTENASAEIAIRKASTRKDATAPIPNLFTFELEAVTVGAPMPEPSIVKNNGSAVNFGPITGYNKEGDYIYRISETEVDAGHPEWMKSDEVIYVKVSVTKNSEENKFEALVSYYSDAECSSELKGEAVKITNEYSASGSLTLKALKSMKTDGTPLGTFEFELLDENGEVLATVTNDGNGEIVFSGLEALSFDQEDDGSTFNFTVKEKIPTLAEQAGMETKYVYDETTYEVAVTVTDNGDGTLTLATTVDGEAYTDSAMKFVNDITTIKVDKVDDEGNGVANAELQVVIKDSEGTVVEKWTSDGQSHDLTGKLVAGETYTLEELSAPNGYVPAEPIEFTVQKDGTVTINGQTVTSVEMVDAKIHFNVNKVDLGNGEEVEGAVLEVYDEDGNLVDSWISKKGETHDFGDKLEAGKSYVLKETVAPDGYKYTTDIDFTVNEDGSITTNAKYTEDENGNRTYLVEDEATTLEVTKIDATTQEPLAGATLQIVNADGDVVEEWVTDENAHVITAKLILGAAYTLVEVEAPEGYEIAEPIEFTVGEDGTIEPIVMEDERTKSENASISVTKLLTFEGEEINAVDQTFYVALYLDEECTKRVSDVKAIEFRNASASTVTFDNLEIGREYFIGECTEDGTVIETGMLEDGTIYAANFAEGHSAVIEREDGSMRVEFENEFYELPHGFYKDGELTITKVLLDAAGNAKDSDEIFYAGVFADADHTTLADFVSENIVALDLAGGSEVSAVIEVSLFDGNPQTVYVTETDEDGNPIAGAAGFKYDVTVSETSVTLDMENSSAEVTITNQEEEEETETETETETEKPKAPKTGDETPIVPYLGLFLAAGFVLVEGERRRRRNNAN